MSYQTVKQIPSFWWNYNSQFAPKKGSICNFFENDIFTLFAKSNSYEHLTRIRGVRPFSTLFVQPLISLVMT